MFFSRLRNYKSTAIALALSFVVLFILVALDAILNAADSNKTDRQSAAKSETEKIDFIKQIQPLLRKRCFSCHGEDEQEGSLRLDLKEHAFKGGDTGKILTAGKSSESPLYLRIAGLGDDERMPPEGEGEPLEHEEVALLKRWIDEGAVWPKSADGSLASRHWAFRSIASDLQPPKVKQADWVLNGIDAFILRKMEQENIVPAPVANRDTLIRRLYLDLIGLPPTPAEWKRWKQESSPDWYEQLVNHLLASPHYGERWGRYWLDVARYADSDGYEKDKPRPHAWRWREWVINALNADMPFDQFTTEQIAGDLLPDATVEQKVATGFHRNTLINREGGTDPEEDRVKRTIDRTNTMGAVWLGLTIECCQCHSHKYDPLSQSEYYSLYAFFNNMVEPDIGAPLPQDIESYTKAKATFDKVHQEKYQAPIAKYKQEKSEAAFDTWEASNPDTTPLWVNLKPQAVKSKKGTTLTIQEDGSVFASGTNPGRQEIYTLTYETKLTDITGFRVEFLTDNRLPGKGPGRQATGNLHFTNFTVKATPLGSPKSAETIALAKPKADVMQSGTSANNPLNASLTSGWSIAPEVGKPHIWTAQTKKPAGFKQGTRLTISLAQSSVLYHNHNIGRFRISVTSAKTPHAFHGMRQSLADILAIPKSNRSALQQQAVLEYFSSIDPQFLALKKASTEHLKKAPANPWRTKKAQTIGEQVGQPRQTHVLIRGDFLQPGRKVDRGGFKALSNIKPRTNKLDRIDLVNWLISADNPLMARVTVNRIWQRHFGRGIVTSINDFGTQGEEPSHPELLDWLATQFRVDGWSMKKLHKLIVTSATYKQTAATRPELKERDPYNAWLTRQNRLRVESEIVRDLALTASGLLVPKIGGPSVRPPQPEGIAKLGYANSLRWTVSKGEDKYRRGLYTFFQRTVPYPTLMQFDSPDSNVTCVKRNRSNTPLQALTLWNDPVFFECAQVMGLRVLQAVPTEKNSDARLIRDERIRHLFTTAFSRQPTASELKIIRTLYNEQLKLTQQSSKAAKQLIGKQKLPENVTAAELATWIVISRTLLNLDEFITRG